MFPFEMEWKGQYGFPELDMASVDSSLQKYDRFPSDYDTFAWDNAWKATEHIINDQLRGVNLKKFTLDEVKNILPGDKACGWPYCTKYQTKEQAWNDSNFLQDFKMFDERMHSDKGVNNFDTIFLKHEMRPIDKCGAGKARTVFCQDVVSACWGTMYNKHFDLTLIDHYARCIHGDCAIAVGMTPFNRTFQHLANKFAGCVCFEMDGSAWDTTMFNEVHQNIAEIRINAYGYEGDEAKALRNYYNQINHTAAVLPNGEVRWRRSGNPSGQSSTTIDNSIWTLTVNIYLLIRWFGKQRITVTNSWLEKYVKWIVYGDDIIFGIKKSLLEHYKIDPQVMINDMLLVATIELGIRFTCSPPGPITTLKWLNKGWGPRHNIWVPTVDPIKMLNSLALCSEIRSPRNTLERTLSLRNESYGTPVVYNYINGYVDWLVARYGIFDLAGAWLTEYELRSLYDGTGLIEVIYNPEWAGHAIPLLHKKASGKEPQKRVQLF